MPVATERSGHLHCCAGNPKTTLSLEVLQFFFLCEPDVGWPGASWCSAKDSAARQLVEVDIAMFRATRTPTDLTSCYRHQ